MEIIPYFDQLSPQGQAIAKTVAGLPTESGERPGVDATRAELVARMLFQGCISDAYSYPSCIDCARYATGRKLCSDVFVVKQQTVVDIIERLPLVDMGLPTVFMAKDIRRTADSALTLASTLFGQAVYREVTGESEV